MAAPPRCRHGTAPARLPPTRTRQHAAHLAARHAVLPAVLPALRRRYHVIDARGLRESNEAGWGGAGWGQASHVATPPTTPRRSSCPTRGAPHVSAAVLALEVVSSHNRLLRRLAGRAAAAREKGGEELVLREHDDRGALDLDVLRAYPVMQWEGRVRSERPGESAGQGSRPPHLRPTDSTSEALLACMRLMPRRSEQTEIGW